MRRPSPVVPFRAKDLTRDNRVSGMVRSRRESVVPFAMEGIALDVEGSHFGVADRNALGIAAAVEVASDGEAGVGGGGADQLDDDLMADEGLAAPVLRM